jgi:hypothetical protein
MFLLPILVYKAKGRLTGRAGFYKKRLQVKNYRIKETLKGLTELNCIKAQRTLANAGNEITTFSL